MTVKVNACIESTTLDGPQTVTVKLDGGLQTSAFVIGEGSTELEARQHAIENLRMVMELLEKSTADGKGWVGTVCDGWSMSPVMNPRKNAW